VRAPIDHSISSAKWICWKTRSSPSSVCLVGCNSRPRRPLPGYEHDDIQRKTSSTTRTRCQDSWDTERERQAAQPVHDARTSRTQREKDKQHNLDMMPGQLGHRERKTSSTTCTRCQDS
jgi:hypothetical protein